MSIELMLNAVNVNLVAFSAHLQDTFTGQIFALFVITVAAAEVGIGLAIVILIYRNREIDRRRRGGPPQMVNAAGPEAETTVSAAWLIPPARRFGVLPDRCSSASERRARAREIGIVAVGASFVVALVVLGQFVGGQRRSTIRSSLFTIGTFHSRSESSSTAWRR